MESDIGRAAWPIQRAGLGCIAGCATAHIFLYVIHVASAPDHALCNPAKRYLTHHQLCTNPEVPFERAPNSACLNIQLNKRTEWATTAMIYEVDVRTLCVI